MKSNKTLQKYFKSTKPIKTLINWYDLYGGYSIKLDQYFKKELFKKAIGKAGNVSELGRKINVGRKVISNILNNRYHPKIRTLIKVAKYIDYPLEDINDEIQKISGLKPKLPFKLNNKEGAEIRAAFLSDGHVDKNLTG